MVPGEQRPGRWLVRLRVVERTARPMVMIGNRHAFDGLGRMAGPPANHGAGEAALAEDVPDGFALPGQVGDGLHGVALGRGFGEAVNAVLKRPFARGDGSPEHGRERRMERSDLAHRPRFHEVLDMGHPARVHQRRDHLPVCRVPADEQHFLAGNRGQENLKVLLRFISARRRLAGDLFAPAQQGNTGRAQRQQHQARGARFRSR